MLKNMHEGEKSIKNIPFNWTNHMEELAEN